MNKNILVKALLIAVSLSGCAHQPTALNESETKAEELLKKKIITASEANNEYSLAIRENFATLPRKQIMLERDRINVDYIGKPESLLQTLANRYGYQYIEIGKRSELPTINIRQGEVTPELLIENIKVQINEAADLLIDKRDKTLRLVYRNKYLDGRG